MERRRMSRDQWVLQPHVASDGWWLKLSISNNIDPEDLIKVLRAKKVLTPRSRFSIIDEYTTSYFYIEFRSIVHGHLFIVRLKNHIEENGGSIL